MDADPKAEIARLQSELDHATKLIDAAEHFRSLIRLDEIAERKRRRLDYGKLATDDYGAIEDCVLLKAIDDLLSRMWNRNDENYRKGRMHLSRLAWELKERLRQKL